MSQHALLLAVSRIVGPGANALVLETSKTTYMYVDPRMLGSGAATRVVIGPVNG